MFELPLFPLNTVLFPGMPLTLQIFEKRYKDMIRWCLDMDQPFGVTLIRNGREAGGPLAEPHDVGCTARITDVEFLNKGRMNIVVLGENRFRIHSLNHELPYLVGVVELYPLDGDLNHSLVQTGQRLLPWVKRYMQILTSVSEIRLDPQQLPKDPLVLAYLAAVLLQVPADQKQDLLASERAIDLLTDMHTIYRREVALLQAMFSDRDTGKGQVFSSN